MSQLSATTYTFGSELPLPAVDSGTTLAVTGSSGRGARLLALKLLLAGEPTLEGVLLAAADNDGEALLERSEALSDDLDRERLGIVDCSGRQGDDRHRFEARGDVIVDPGNLSLVEFELAALYDVLAERNYPRVRIGIFSLSSFLQHASLREVSRFVHLLVGRIISFNDLGIFVIDQSIIDDRSAKTLCQLCEARVDVRTRDGGFEARLEGVVDEPMNWTPVDLEPTV